MNFLIKLVLTAISAMIAAYLLPGVEVDRFTSALILAAILALLNVTLKPILIVITIPITVVTLGVFLLVINTLIILIAESVIGGFEIANFWWALGFSLLLSMLTSIFNGMAGLNNKDNNNGVNVR